MLGNLSFCLSFIVLGIWLMKYDSIKRRFVKSSSKSRILALVQSMECSLSKTCLGSADLSNRRCRMSAKCSFLRMEKLRFVSPMYEKSQSWQGICDFSYIGETKRSFSIRKKEHLADIRHLRFDKSALPKHVFDNEHSMDWTNAKILDFELDFTKHRFIESYFINQIPNTMNDKQNDKFPSIYSATLLQTT